MRGNIHTGLTTTILLFALLGTIFAASCAGEISGTTLLTTSHESENTTGIQTQAETDIMEGLDVINLEDMTFTVLSSDVNGWNNHYEEELSGDVVNDTIWKRDALTEQRLSVNIKTTVLSGMTASDVTKSVQANDFICDMFYFAFSSELSTLLKADCTYALNDIPYLDLNGACNDA